MALKLTMNGQTRVFDRLEVGATLANLIEALELKGDRVALELNGEIAPRSAWATMPLNQEDRVELVHFVGGGSGVLESQGSAVVRLERCLAVVETNFF